MKKTKLYVSCYLLPYHTISPMKPTITSSLYRVISSSPSWNMSPNHLRLLRLQCPWPSELLVSLHETPWVPIRTPYTSAGTFIHLRTIRKNLVFAVLTQRLAEASRLARYLAESFDHKASMESRCCLTFTLRCTWDANRRSFLDLERVFQFFPPNRIYIRNDALHNRCVNLIYIFGRTPQFLPTKFLKT